jgi:outer membrane protein
LGAVVLAALVGISGLADAADDMSWKHEGTAPEGKVTVGFRVGMALNTQEVVDNSDTGVGPAINFQATYGVNKWFNVGALLTWQRFSVDVQQPKSDLASIDTVTLLPVYVEFRPGHFGKIQPYLSTGIGVNINSIGESDAIKRAGTRFSAGNTFAWRTAGGIDFPITPHIVLNTEFAVNRNRGTIDTKQNGQVTSKDPFDASSMNILFGAKFMF